MSALPRRPEHADRVEPIAGADPRLTIRRVLDGYAYPRHGNLHNPTPRYVWHLLADGRIADVAPRRSVLVQAAREHGADYLK